MKKAATIRDVAAHAGVSVSVVSRVLNGTGPVAPAKRAQVLEAIDTLAYRPRAAARELSHGRSDTIGLLLADLTNPFFARLADRVVAEARSRDLQILLMTTQEDPHLEAQALDTLLDRSVGAMIGTPTGHNVERWEKLAALDIPVVFVDRALGELAQVDVVSIENVGSAVTATRHLLDRGHTRVGIVSGPLDTSTGIERVQGYEQALRERGIARDDGLVRPAPFRGDLGAEVVAQMLALDDPPTGLVVANTAQVRVVLRMLAQARIAIPDDLSVVVFDDNPWTELIRPPLTAVRQPIDMLALHSVELAHARMRQKLPPAPRRIRVVAEFLERSSTARI
ncbi:LacI family DNA-binding transcriptional regulator [Pseudonocardia kunmingensis]|uniref:LacI family transcriptional regulator n=1 Tax=Pseudonocardia kunmingensis TaxID=630975 RepID=A0A543DN38_9PSEU|nr:substrate-binding domain-containing protein [Pseudonocardia kunmingensis]TQM10749.1 LacI family transcriptional regulator [Pseudonocardia kunmingensis]